MIKLQHRGQESAGVCFYGSQNCIDCIKGIGLVGSALKDVPSGGGLAMGHVRYSTSRGSDPIKEAQPLVVKTERGDFAMCHNGNIPLELRYESKEGENDSNFIARKISELLSDGLSMLDVAKTIVRTVNVAYCLMIMYEKNIYLVRDRNGVRPLSIAKGILNGEDAVWVSSESCAYPSIVNGGCSIVSSKDIKPGEVCCISGNTWESFKVLDPTPALCSFEYVYFLRSETVSDGVLVENARRSMGSYLARQDINNRTTPPPGSVIVGAPYSGIVSGEGYASEIDMEYIQVISRKNKERTFIEKSQRHRIDAVYRKFEIDGDINGRSIVFVDDSLVRGNTVKGIVHLLKDAGAKEIHIRIASPPIKNPCYFGIDIPDRKDLIAVGNDIGDIAEIVGADSLVYLERDRMINSIKMNGLSHEDMEGLCSGCFDGNYCGMVSW